MTTVRNSRNVPHESGNHRSGVGPVSRRDVLGKALTLSASALLTSALSTPSQAEGPDASPQSGVAGPVTGVLRAPRRAGPGGPPGTWLVLLGTRGGPGIDPHRAQTASAVLVDGHPYLIDCGYGTLRQLVASGVDYLQVSTILFTHLHDDHTADLTALLSFQWSNGKTTATDAHGPHGTARLVEAVESFLRTDTEIRTADEGRTVNASTQFHGHDVPASAVPVHMFEDDRVRVTAVENTHYPSRTKARVPDRSLALRVDTPGRSIVFSGDTAYSANVVALARDADVFVCEIIDPTVLEQMRERAKAAEAAGHPINLYRHVAETHCSPADVARMASEAHVGTVVLNHQVSGPSGNYPATTLIDGVRRGFSGEVILGEDLMIV